MTVAHTRRFRLNPQRSVTMLVSIKMTEMANQIKVGGDGLPFTYAEREVSV